MGYFREIEERYDLGEPLPARPWASVCRAVDAATGAATIVKRFPLTGSPEAAQRFVRALGMQSELHHPALPRVLDFGFVPDGSAFLVLEPLAGRSAVEFVGAPPLQLLPLLRQAADGLEVMARQGLAHLNLSPDNLLVTLGPDGREQVKILGLGSALLREAAPPEGPAAFAAPELFAPAEAARADWRADLYSLALVACSLLEARVQGAGTAAPTVNLPLSLTFELEDVEGLQETLERCLWRDPRERPGAWEDLRRALRRALPEGASSLPQARLNFVTTPPEEEFPGVALAAGGAAARREEAPPGEDAGDSTNPVLQLEPGGPPVSLRPDLLSETLFPLASLAPPPLLEPIPPPLPEVPSQAAAIVPPESVLAAPPAPPPAEPLAAEELLPALDDPLAPLAVAPPMPPSPPIPPGSPTAHPPSTPALSPRRPRPSRKAVAIGIGAAVLSLALIAALFVGTRSTVSYEPGSTSAAGSVSDESAATPGSTAATAATAATGSDTAGLTPAESAALAPLHPALAAAAAAFAAGDDAGARRALVAFPSIGAPGRADITAGDCAAYLGLSQALDLARRDRLALDLKHGLASGDVPLLAATARAFPPRDDVLLAAAGAGLKKDLAEARRAAQLYQGLQKAEHDHNLGQTLEAVGTLMTAFPNWKGAAPSREAAAAALEAEADALYQTGALDAALARLEPLQRSWPDRPGLAERRERYSSERRSDQSLERVLAAAAQAEARKRPDEGLATLKGARPTPRLEARFREARQRLERQLAELDKAPPALAFAAATPLEFEKGTAVAVTFRATDDYQVAHVTARARPVGAPAWTELPIELVGRAEGSYRVEVPAALHQNRDFEVLVSASDLSGHHADQGPRQIRRQKWYQKLRPRKEGGGGGG